jgi:hypothetical protein
MLKSRYLIRNRENSISKLEKRQAVEVHLLEEEEVMH